MASVRICTRPSRLAIVQAEMVANALNDIGLETETLKVTSTGDIDLSSPLYKIGGSGIFVEEVNRKVISGDCDLAVHSAKDLPSELPEGIVILGVLRREEPNDAIISREGLDKLPRGSIVGTSSTRRIHQLKMVRPDLKVENIRGNLDTRIRKFSEGLFDGIILAKAGIKRMGVDVDFHDLSLEDFLPAPNQGIIAIVGKRDSPFAAEVGKISHRETFEEMAAERRLISALKLGCSLPAAILCRRENGMYRVRTRFYSQSSREYKEFSRTFSDISEVDQLAREIIEKVPASYGFDFQER